MKNTKESEHFSLNKADKSPVMLKKVPKIGRKIGNEIR